MKGEANVNNIPGSRYAELSWKDSTDNFWLFGGMGFDNVTGGDMFYLNDLWKYDGVNWIWVSGNYSANNLGNYGVKGVANANNAPGARYLSGSWIDSENNLWLFGGNGYANITGVDYLNDLWKFDGENWIWISGNYTLNQNATFGIKGVADLNNVPGLVDALNSLTAGVDDSLAIESRCEFDLNRYESHIQAHIQDFPVSLTDIPPLSEHRKKDLIWRFIAVIFLSHAGTVDLWQEGQAIMVKKHEANREGQDVPAELEGANGVEGSMGRVEAG